jgi:hypothetical protein
MPVTAPLLLFLTDKTSRLEMAETKKRSLSEERSVTRTPIAKMLQNPSVTSVTARPSHQAVKITRIAKTQVALSVQMDSVCRQRPIVKAMRIVQILHCLLVFVAVASRAWIGLVATIASVPIRRNPFVRIRPAWLVLRASPFAQIDV